MRRKAIYHKQKKLIQSCNIKDLPKTLQVIPEETEANDSDVPQQEFMAGLGLPKGVQMDTNLFQVVGVETVFQERVEDLQFENLDFVLTE